MDEKTSYKKGNLRPYIVKRIGPKTQQTHVQQNIRAETIVPTLISIPINLVFIPLPSAVADLTTYCCSVKVILQIQAFPALALPLVQEARLAKQAEHKVEQLPAPTSGLIPPAEVPAKA